MWKSIIILISTFGHPPNYDDCNVVKEFFAQHQNLKNVVGGPTEYQFYKCYQVNICAAYHQFCHQF